MTAVRIPLLSSVRLSRGQTQASLAALTRASFGARGLSQAVISKLEDGLIPLDDARAEVLAAVLEVPRELLDSPQSDPLLLHSFQSSLPAGQRRLLLAHAELARVHLTRLPLRGMGAPHSGITSHTIPKHASWLRAHWNVGHGPIPSMVDLVEAHGIACLSRDLGSVKATAVGSWRRGSIMFLDGMADDFQVRFAMAHELGHAVMQRSPDKSTEAAADEFASHFLLPAEEVLDDLSGVDLEKLIALERKWRVSAVRLAHRAKQLGAVSPTRHRTLIATLKSQRGGRPRRSDRERPKKVSAAVLSRVRDGESYTDVARSMLLDEAELRTGYLAGSTSRASS